MLVPEAFVDEYGDDDEPAPEGDRHQVEIGDDLAGTRLDKALAASLPFLSRSRLQSLLEEGHVAADGRTVTEASYRVKPGQSFEIRIPDPEPAAPVAQGIPLSIVYEDDDLLVIDKAAGMVVHPAAGNPDGTLVNALLAHCGGRLSGVGGVRRPGIVHRLDKDTSGLMLVAKNDLAHKGLAAQLADRTLSRVYRAIVRGAPQPRDGVIDLAIGRSRADRKRMAVVDTGGKAAVTDYRTMRSAGLIASLVECRLKTGRTHQIRVHMAAIGHPLVGDPLYGGRARVTAGASERMRAAIAGFPRQALHAAALRFRHPRNGALQEFASALPSDFSNLARDLELV